MLEQAACEGTEVQVMKWTQKVGRVNNCVPVIQLLPTPWRMQMEFHLRDLSFMSAEHDVKACHSAGRSITKRHAVSNKLSRWDASVTHMHLTSSHMYSTWLMLFYGKFHLLKTFFMDIGKDKRIVDFLAGVHGLGNACKLIFGDNILEHRTGRLLFYCEGSIS